MEEVARGQSEEKQHVKGQQSALHLESLPPDRVVHQAVRQASLEGAAYGQGGAKKDLETGEEEGDHEDRENETLYGEPALLLGGDGEREHVDYYCAQHSSRPHSGRQFHQTE